MKSQEIKPILPLTNSLPIDSNAMIMPNTMQNEQQRPSAIFNPLLLKNQEQENTGVITDIPRYSSYSTKVETEPPIQQATIPSPSSSTNKEQPTTAPIIQSSSSSPPSATPANTPLEPITPTNDLIPTKPNDQNNSLPTQQPQIQLTHPTQTKIQNQPSIIPSQPTAPINQQPVTPAPQATAEPFIIQAITTPTSLIEKSTPSKLNSENNTQPTQQHPQSVQQAQTTVHTQTNTLSQHQTKLSIQPAPSALPSSPQPLISQSVSISPTIKSTTLLPTNPATPKPTSQPTLENQVGITPSPMQPPTNKMTISLPQEILAPLQGKTIKTITLDSNEKPTIKTILASAIHSTEPYIKQQVTLPSTTQPIEIIIPKANQQLSIHNNQIALTPELTLTPKTLFISMVTAQGLRTINLPLKLSENPLIQITGIMISQHNKCIIFINDIGIDLKPTLITGLTHQLGMNLLFSTPTTKNINVSTETSHSSYNFAYTFLNLFAIQAKRAVIPTGQQPIILHS